MIKLLFLLLIPVSSVAQTPKGFFVRNGVMKYWDGVNDSVTLTYTGVSTQILSDSAALLRTAINAKLSADGSGAALTGLTKTQVGLSNVDNTSNATERAASAVMSSKTIATFNYAADAGANDSYVISLSPAPASYTTGMMVIFKANTANTTGCTINVNSLGVKNIVKRVSTTPATGDILQNMFCWLVYDGTNFVLLNPVVN